MVYVWGGEWDKIKQTVKIGDLSQFYRQMAGKDFDCVTIDYNSRRYIFTEKLKTRFDFKVIGY